MCSDSKTRMEKRAFVVYPVQVRNRIPIIALLSLSATLLLGAAESNPNLFRVRHTTDVNGQAHLLGEVTGTKAIVLVFLGPECPISQRYVPELNRIAKEQRTNAVEFCGVLSAPSITHTQAVTFVKEYALNFPVLFDEAGALGRWLHPTHVPEVFVLKPDGDVVYRGRIDDWYESPGKPRAVVRHHELRDALTALNAGRAPPRFFAPPVGCYFEEWR